MSKHYVIKNKEDDNCCTTYPKLAISPHQLNICEIDFEKQELEVYKNAFNQMSVEYAIAKGLTDVRDVQYAILDKAREEVEKEKKDDTK